MRGELEKLLRRDDLSPWQLLGLARFIATRQELSTTERNRYLLTVSVRLERHAAEVVGLLAPPLGPIPDAREP